ncbi:MAG: Clp protease ClpS [Bacteroidetes bacterium QS_8_68_15]|nr:MAG: Clp protease ClpS [Bacteroidetes bacterium QS_8_68_15]
MLRTSDALFAGPPADSLPAEPEGAEPEVVPPPEEAPPETEDVPFEDTDYRLDDPWRVILFNDEIHTFEEVIGQLCKATGCTRGEAEEHAWEVHSTGKSAVYEGEFEDCFEVQGVLREIQLVTEIEG